jgi:hypothetical protein
MTMANRPLPTSGSAGAEERSNAALVGGWDAGGRCHSTLNVQWVVVERTHPPGSRLELYLTALSSRLLPNGVKRFGLASGVANSLRR